MTREEYLNKRRELLGDAEAHVQASEVDQAENVMTDIENLDAAYESEVVATANIRALEDRVVGVDISSRSSFVSGGKVMEKFNLNEVANTNVTATSEYRQAFMNHVLLKQAMPENFLNADAVTQTTDIGVLIPETILERIIEKIEATGMILPLVTRTAIKGGISVPYATAKPVASWVSEGVGSEKQKKGIDGTITFAYHKLRCAVAISLETDTMALSIFESNLIASVAEAMLRAIERSIISGTGVGQPKGILAETTESGQSLSARELSYDLLIEAESVLPMEYEEGAVYCMTKKTFMAYQGIVDTTGQPIARVAYGIGGKPERTLLGRTVVLTNYLPSFSETLEDDKVFAFIFNFGDYLLNTNYSMGMKRYEDNDTDDQIMKSIMLVDGKVLVKNSLVTIKKVSA